MLRDEELKEAYWDGFYSNGSSMTYGLRAVAEAAVQAEREGMVPVGGVIVLSDGDEHPQFYYNANGASLPIGDHKLCLCPTTTNSVKSNT